MMLQLVVVTMLSVVTASIAATPEQIHIALTANHGEMLVSWAITPAPSRPISGFVKCWSVGGSLDYTFRANAVAHTYTAGGFDGLLYEATIKNLTDTAQVTYMYTVTVGNESSTTFDFNYNPGAESIKFLSYGDMGVKNSFGTSKLAGEYATGDGDSGFDLLVNVGDTSYADDYLPMTNAKYFDEHFRDIQDHAARMPFMTVAGNHERQFDFAAYLNRLRMPLVGTGNLSRFYYSFDYGPVHFLSYSSEHSFAEGSEQWKFIQNDLALASTSSARKQRPWIVMWSHRPLYCSDLAKWEGRCLREANEYRANIEKLMVAANVDVHICGHNHQYERSYPVHGCADNYTSSCIITKSYDNPPAPVYIVNGAAGDVEGADPTWIEDGSKVPFRAAHDGGLHTGLAKFVVNKTAMDISFVYTGDRAIPETNASNLKDFGVVADHFVITKTEL